MTRFAICTACVLTILACFPVSSQSLGTPPLPINPGSQIPAELCAYVGRV
jgi:hypothetical protein